MMWTLWPWGPPDVSLLCQFGLHSLCPAVLADGSQCMCVRCSHGEAGEE